MASLHPAPNMAPGNVTLPPNLTQQNVQEILQKYKQMQEQGVRADDPEFQKAHNLLSMIQRQQAFAKQQRMAQQQAQQQRPPQQTNGGINAEAVAANSASSAHGELPPCHLELSMSPHPRHSVELATQFDTMINASTARTASASSTTNPNASAASAQNQKNAPVPGGNFSPEQLATLRNQILAFKMLSKNLAIPPRVQEQLFQKKSQTPTPTETIATAEKVIESANERPGSSVPENVDSEVLTREWYDNFQSPYDSLSSTISYTDHAKRANRVRIPALLPPGIDLEQIREDREVAVYNKITARKAELAQLPANLGVWDTSKTDTPTYDDSLKLKALIEWKSLNLLQKQRQCRKQHQGEMFHYSNLGMTANRSSHRRMKKQSLREARITEKLEKQQRDARESREKKKQFDQIQAILNHSVELANAAGQQRARSQKLGRMMISHHQHMEREEQRRVERTAKQRLQALKANDEETYLKLLGQAKDSRISHLLKQTDNFLKQLAASVKEQQRSLANRYGDEPVPDEESDQEIADSENEDDDTTASGKKKVDYYAVAHRIQEEVTTQPNMLKGGTLKEYQLKGLQWMISLYNNNLNGILADEMGLGKTIQTISLITHIIEKKKNNGPFLVIVPLSTLTNWNNEFENNSSKFDGVNSRFSSPPTSTLSRTALF
ncbi:unnamed protein product [Penicillium salamii]|nr:unnamed protein product [Penicillium salamii]CAG8244302.1 unnamed protein product [Penicillium salamii]CAG8407010.1 unnamed protein product [Penicillium salamii]CAG8422023.1 unnamed protein product [Penicillium salamii]CAG8883201.1 unnamed protein product [Penicillium salamii]